MIILGSLPFELKRFPDGTPCIKLSDEQLCDYAYRRKITWRFESNEELVYIMLLVKYLRDRGMGVPELCMPYIPNARMDRVHKRNEVFTLKYFAEIINSLGFPSVTVEDPHSHVSEALLDRVRVKHPTSHIVSVIKRLGTENLMLYYPDEGAMKRYTPLIDEVRSAVLETLGYDIERKCVFGMKNRDWETGEINGITVLGAVDDIKGKRILIVDDICSRGGTFYHSAKCLKELGAGEIYLYVTHCENTIFDGDMLSSGLIEKVYTTNSIYTGSDDRIEVV